MSREEFELKSNEQILLMRKAGLITEAALDAVRAAIKPGISTLELDRIANETIESFGAKSNFQLVPGYFHTICASINDEVVHGIPSADRILQPGDLVSIDAGAIIDGWNGDSAISVVVPGGDPKISAARERVSRVTEMSLWHGIAALAKGKRLNDVGVAIEKYVNSQGKFGILEQYVGHGIGRSMHEDPPVFNYAVRGLTPKIVPGLVVAIEPMVTAGTEITKVLDDDWTVSTIDGSDASHWEHTVAVHEGGIWVLTAKDGGAEQLAKLGVTVAPLGE
jgi:methionyl aminopeptidase